MSYQNPAAFREAAKAELEFFKRQDPRPALAVLGWTKVEGKAAARYEKFGRQIDLWGGKNPGDFFAFNNTGVRGRSVSIIDLALDHVGRGDGDWKRAADLLRKTFTPGGVALSGWTDGSDQIDISAPFASFLKMTGSPVDAGTASRLRSIPDGFRVPHQEIGSSGLKVIGWTDISLSEDGTLNETFAGRIGLWASPSTDCTSIRIYNDLADALLPEEGVMRIWCPRGADGMLEQICKVAIEKLELDHVTVCARDTFEGDTRRGMIRAKLASFGIETKGSIVI